jgi:uncharacterized membrane protein (UPF0127 family)
MMVSIRNLVDMKPQTTDLIARRKIGSLALEMNQGWFAKKAQQDQKLGGAPQANNVSQHPFKSGLRSPDQHQSRN